MAGAIGDDPGDDRLQPLADEGLQNMAFDRKAKPGGLHHAAAAAGDGAADLARGDEPAACLDARAAAVLDAEPGHLAILDDIDAAPVGSAGIAPGHRVMTHGAAAPLHQRALNRKAAIVEIQERDLGAQLFGIEKLGVGAVQDHRIAAPPIGVALPVGMIDVIDAALADHRVVVEILLQPFPELQRQFIEGRVAFKKIVGTDDGGVAPDVAAADPALFQNRDRSLAKLACQIIGGGKTMAAAADNHEIIGRLWCRIAPGRPPAPVAGQTFSQNPEAGIVSGPSPLGIHGTSRRATGPLPG